MPAGVHPRWSFTGVTLCRPTGNHGVAYQADARLDLICLSCGRVARNQGFGPVEVYSTRLFGRGALRHTLSRVAGPFHNSDCQRLPVGTAKRQTGVCPGTRGTGIRRRLCRRIPASCGVSAGGWNGCRGGDPDRTVPGRACPPTRRRRTSVAPGRLYRRRYRLHRVRSPGG